MQIIGWTLGQWSLALAKFDIEVMSIGQALDIKREYLIKYRTSPIDKPTIYNPNGDERKRDWDNADKLLKLVLAKGVMIG